MSIVIFIIIAIMVIMAIISHTSTMEHFEQNIDHNMISQRSDLMRVFED